MSDFPGVFNRPNTTILSTVGLSSVFGEGCLTPNLAVGNGAWAVANQAVYVPIVLEQKATAYKMAFVVGAQAGNYDVGIYDETGVLLVSLGSTTVPVAGIAVADIADTALNPGVYFLAMNCSTVTTLTVSRINTGVPQGQMGGVQSQAVGATALPATATFASPLATGVIPVLTCALTSVI